MKKSLILGILGLAAGAVTTYGQGAVFLDNYHSSTYNPVIYGSGGGGAVGSGFTVQLYYDLTAGANIAAAVNTAASNDTSHNGDVTTFGALTAATGAGATAGVDTGSAAVPGYFESGASFLIQASGATQNSYTVLLVAYNGANYASSTIRGYSSAVFYQDASVNTTYGADTGTALSGITGIGSGTSDLTHPIITVYSVVPEPTTMALAGLGGLGLLLFRRKQV